MLESGRAFSRACVLLAAASKWIRCSKHRRAVWTPCLVSMFLQPRSALAWLLSRSSHHTHTGRQSCDVAGKLRCLSCGRVCSSYAVLAQHLKDKHDGVNSADLQDMSSASAGGSGGGFSLGDMLAKKLEAASARPPAHEASAAGSRGRGTAAPANASGPQDIRALLKVQRLMWALHAMNIRQHQQTCSDPDMLTLILRTHMACPLKSIRRLHLAPAIIWLSIAAGLLCKAHSLTHPNAPISCTAMISPGS